jgi:HlyD family secretion protein
VLGSVDEQDIAAARANYADAQARLERITGQRREGLVDSARADLAIAETNLALLMADPSTEDLTVAEARVARAEVGVKRAKLDLAQLTLVAPHDGTIVGVDVSIGQVVEARKSVLSLADLSSWRLQTEDLSELNVVSIREGDTATINFFALPDLKLTGKVSRIDALGVNDRTVGVTYVATIIPDSWDPRLRWNMTATVEIGGAEASQ